MSFPVVYDANVLYPPTLRHVLIQIAQTGLVHARWTDEILDEVFRNVSANNPQIPAERLQRTRELMCEAVADCLITGYEPIVKTLTLPDAGDRHVLAAAIRARAATIVTFNLDDFPADELAPWDIEAKHPDEFLLDQFHLDGVAVHAAVQAVADSMRNPPAAFNDVVDTLERTQLPRAAAILRR
ncbi:PIN domain-containing protein [Leifsonia aquatica]|uniref:PIN domain-containing protein n=1 Tax=Leifsonia aquatica TaxID=144185 RepID=UPI0038108044